jgi:hypothetical protein
MPQYGNEPCPARRAKSLQLFVEVPAGQREEKASGMAPTGVAGGSETRNRMGVVGAHSLHGSRFRGI